MKQYRAHPLAGVFPMLTRSKLRELAEDIAKNGLRQPIILFEGRILDGRNRYAACKLAKVEGVFEEFIGGYADAVALSWSANFKRRHLNESQRAIAISRHREVVMGRPGKSPSREGFKTAAEDAKEAEVSIATIERARLVVKSSHAISNAIEQGNLKLGTAVKLLKEMPKEKVAALEGKVLSKLDCDRMSGASAKRPETHVEDFGKAIRAANKTLDWLNSLGHPAGVAEALSTYRLEMSRLGHSFKAALAKRL